MLRDDHWVLMKDGWCWITGRKLIHQQLAHINQKGAGARPSPRRARRSLAAVDKAETGTRSSPPPSTRLPPEVALKIVQLLQLLFSVSTKKALMVGEECDVSEMKTNDKICFCNIDAHRRK